MKTNTGTNRNCYRRFKSIGKAMALILKMYGYAIVAVDWDTKQLNEVVDKIITQSCHTASYVGDVTQVK